MVSATRRVLVLTSDTGAGHRSVSGALVEAAHARPGGLLELVEIDPLAPLPPALRRRRTAESPSLFDRAIRLYGAATVHVPWLWGWGFHAADNDLGLAAYLALAGARVGQRIAEAIERTDAAAVVSVHPLVNQPMARARARRRRASLPLMTVVTDLVDVHRWWASREVDQYVAGSPVAAGQLRARGIAAPRIATLGIPLRAAFSRLNVSAREMRARLDLDADLPVVLLTGGGDGAGRLPETARALAAVEAAAAGPRFQLVVLAGRNQRARRELEAQAWPMPTRLHGFVPNIAEYMTAADVVVTKPGSLTISEALALGRPLLLGRPLPGQEEGNVRYVVEAGAGFAYRSPAEAAEAAAFLLANPAARWEMGQRAARASHPRATERTLDLLQGLLLRAEAQRR